MAHCFTCSKDLKAGVRIARGLAGHGWSVLRFDFAGLGNSDGNFAESNFRTNRFDLLAACEFMANEIGPPSLLFGHSFGGAAAMSIADEISSVRGVVSLAAPSETHHLADFLARSDPRLESEGIGEAVIGGRKFPIARQMLEDFRSYNLEADLSRLSKPLLILHSTADETVGYHHALRIYSLVQQANSERPERPDVSLFTLPKSDHLLVNNPHDLPLVIGMVHIWAKRLIADRMSPKEST
jgi:putative redox protein